MNFLRKFKDYVLGEVSWSIITSPSLCILRMLRLQTAMQDLKETSTPSSEASSSSTAPAGFVQKVAVKQTVQPVLQNPGYGSSGGVQVMCCTSLQPTPEVSRCTGLISEHTSGCLFMPCPVMGPMLSRPMQLYCRRSLLMRTLRLEWYSESMVRQQ